jgi:hypothetical protein
VPVGVREAPDPEPGREVSNFVNHRRSLAYLVDEVRSRSSSYE